MNRKASAPFLIRFLVLFSLILSASAASYATTVATPTFSPAAGSYTGTQSVTISDTTSGATIYYTTDGTPPTSGSTHYTSAISVSTSETIKAIAEKSGDVNSSVASAAYTITVATPTFSPAAGSYTGTQSVTISDANSSATIYYTTDGSTPSSGSTHYTGTISVSKSETIKAIAEFSGATNSATASAAYTITVPTPTFSPAAGSYTGTQSVTLSDANTSATIYYTTNGNTPNSGSTQYITGTPVQVSTSETIKAIAEFPGATNSAVASAAYTITVATPTFSPVAGSYIGTQSVSISDANSAATIYYTTNGTTPNSGSTQYNPNNHIQVTTSETIKAIAEFSGATNSAVASASYTISPIVSAWPAASAITYGQTLASSTLSGGTALVAGTFAWTTPSTSPGAGTPSENVTFTPSNTTLYNPSTGSVTVTVNKATPTITWPTPAAITYGTALSATQLDATTTPTGTFAYTPTFGTVLSPGSQTLTTTFTPSDTTDYQTVTASTTLTVSAIPGPGIITTVAGNGYWGYTGDGGPATSATFTTTPGVAVDSSGNLYISDLQNSVIRKVTASTGQVSTIAGNGTAGYSGDGGPAINAQISSPNGIVVDSSGNIYFADYGDNVIRKIAASSGYIATVAGNGNWGFSGDGGQATSAEFGGAVDVAVDSAGNLYIADPYNMRIRKVSAATGIITTIAGNGAAGYAGNGGAATFAELYWPYGVAVDPFGNIYIAELNNNDVRKVNASSGIITTVAGNQTQGYSGDNGQATSAELNSPFGVTVDAAGNLYISDTGNNVIREVAANTGIITTVAGNGTAGSAGDGGPAVGAELYNPEYLSTDSSGNIYIPDDKNVRIRIVGSTVNEPVTTMPTITWATPLPITYGTPLSATQLNATTNVPGTFTYIPSSGTVLTAGLYSLTAVFTPTDTTHYSPALATVALTVDQATPIVTWTPAAPIVYGVALSGAQLNATANVPGTFDYTPGAGTLLAPGQQTITATFTPADSVDYTSASATVTMTISSLPPSGIITTIAGDGFWGRSGDGGLAINAELGQPSSVAVDASGNIFIADPAEAVVRKIDASTSIITTVAGTGTSGYSGDGALAINAQLTNPIGIALDAAGNLYIADQNVVREVTASTGIITTVAGTGPNGFSGDGGPATSAALCDVSSVAVDALGNLYIGDSGNGRVRKVTPLNGNIANGTIETFAGGGSGGDGGQANLAHLGDGLYVALDRAGNLYVADSIDNVVRKVTTDGIIHTIVGNGTAGYAGDGGPANAAELNTPQGISVDANGDIFIGDGDNNVVREVTASNGNIITVAGKGSAGFCGDGGPAISAELNNPHGVAVDSAGNLYIADYSNHRVRAVGAVPLGSQVAQPVFTPVAGSYSGPQTVTISTTTAGASINYTTDGSTPSPTHGTLYTLPIMVSQPETIHAIAFETGLTSSSVVSAVYSFPVSVAIAPTSVILSSNGEQQFTATVVNTTNTAVTWSILPSGIGSISQSGLYIAPSTVTAQQTVTVTTTSQADTTKSASAVVTLVPTNCNSNGYSYVRAININHTKVLNSDQTKFPFLFNTTDPLLAAVANGGHVQNPNGYDIIFTSDAAGQNPLPYEMEEYNPQTGHVIAWVQIPDLSHTSDTAIFMFYGNSSVAASQQNPAGVWGTNYAGVWHLPNGTSLSANDSTANENNGTPGTGVGANAGFIDGGASFSGASTAYITLPSSSAAWNFANDVTVSAWIKTAGNGMGVLLLQPGTPLVYLEVGPTTAGGASNNAVAYFRADDGGLVIANGKTAVNDNNWHNIQAVRSTGNSVNIYVDGILDSTTPYADPNPIDASGGGAAIGGLNSSYDFIGAIDEVRVSNVARSSDWIATEYNNQSSPGTFYSFSPENEPIAPSAVTLYSQQSQQFAVTALVSCEASIVWSINPPGVGTLTQTGSNTALYTAPTGITTQQTVAVTATNTASSEAASAAVTLMPPAAITVSPNPASVPFGGEQQFTATVSNATNTAVTWTISPPGTGKINANGLYTAPNISFSGGNFTLASLALNGSATVTSNGALQLTDGGGSENASSWYPAKVPVAAFSTNFSFQMVKGFYGFADGMTFTVQGDGITALGGTGVDLGYAGIPNSVAIKFDTFNDDGEGTDSTGIYTDGAIPAIPAIDLTPTGIILQSGDVIDANLVYDGTFLTLSLADTTTKATAQEVFKVDIPSLVGGTTAYVGFTGATGAQGSIQTLLSWNYMSLTQQVVDVTATSQADPSASGSASVTLQPPVAISASPANVALYGGQAQQFTANVINTTNRSVTWSISPASGAGSISSSGLFTAPGMVTTQTAVTVTATSVANPTATATLTVMLVPHVALTVTPSIANLYNGQTQQFTASVTGNSDMAVTWSLTPAPLTLFPNGLGTINAAGMYTAPANITNGQAVLVTATSAANSTVNATATVNLLPAPTTINIGLSATSPVYFPNTSQLSATVSDSSLPAGQTPAVQWSQISGPGTVAFANAQGTSTTALFSEVGTYTIQLTATDSLNSASAQLIVLDEDSPSLTQGWIGSPMTGSAVSGLVPITVAAGETLSSGTLTYYPTTNIQASVVLNADTTGSGQIGVLDTTSLANGSYEIALQATDSNGNTEYSLSFVTVTGNYKPGRVTTTVTDLVVPATGLAINIQRTYDSLNAETIGDFGYGWNLGINVNLVVDSKGDVTFTLGGHRRTFYLTPQPVACSPLVGCLFPWFTPDFTPEPGMFGALTESSPGCLFDMLLADGECEGGGYYNPPGYIYTDPTGTQYTISAGGSLQSVTDRNGNGLTITPNGITSTTGLNVPFVRDAQNRITQITDPQGNVYLYGYDANGNLATVTYPPTTNSQTCSGASAPNTSQYTYYTTPAHFYESGTDARCNPLPTTQYYAAGATDSNGNSLAGKLQSVTDSLGETTSYAYTLSATSNINGVEVPNTGITAVTYPADAGGNIGHATMIYDSLGDLLSTTDPLNHTTTNTYDANQNLLSTTDPLGHTTSYTYDANGNKTSQTYPATATSTNTTSTTNYNQFSEPTSTTDELGNVRAFNYDASYNPASVTDSAGTLMSTQFNSNGTMAAGAIGYDITQNPSRASQFTYDANGDLTSKTDALGRTTSYTYNTLGQKVTMVEPIPSGSNAAAATTTYQYDAFGNLTQTSAPLGRVTSSQYDGNSNKTSDTDARGHTTTYQYDNLNRLILTTYPDTTTSSKTYDFRNNVVRETDQGGHVTLHQYDLAGRQIAVTQAYGTANATTTSYTYDNAGRKTAETDALSHAASYTYDAAGNLTAISGVKGSFTYAYDNARNRTSMTDGNSNTTRYQYDARKRLTLTTYPDSTTKTNAYDGPGNLNSVTDQAGNQVQYTYDAANQLASVVQVNSPNTDANTTIYGYDANGNSITFEDANSHTTVNSFDLLNETTAKTLPDGTLTETRQYDNNGNLSSVTHFNGAVTTYTYDTLNRLLSRATPGETTVSHTYTSTGKYLTTTDSSGTTNYSYDTMDRLTAKATPEGTLNYTYDAAGHVASIASSNTNGASMSYTYDSLNRLSTVVDNRLSGSNTTTHTYDNASNVALITDPNGVQSSFAYDSLNRVSSLNSQLSGYTYQRGPTGNLTGSTESNGRAESWNYDGTYRLTNETISLAPSGKNGSVGYGLDPVGNRTSDTSSLSGISSGSFGYNPDDELASESYDQNGNVLATGGKTFAYDSQNDLISMGGTATLLYDADGNRVSKTVSGVVTKYLVDDLNPTGYPQVFDELTNSGVTRTYTYGLQRIDEEQIISSTWTPSFYGYDGGGNVRQLTNSSGAITDTYEFDAFGNEVNHTGTTLNNYLYRGEQYDSDLGLYYLRARYYNPLTGRFMSRDPDEPKLIDSDRKPIDPKKLHKYLYANGDPVNLADPRGRDAILQFVFTTADISSPVTAYEYGFGIGVATAYACYANTIYAILHWAYTSEPLGPLDLGCLVVAGGTGP